MFPLPNQSSSLPRAEAYAVIGQHALFDVPGRGRWKPSLTARSLRCTITTADGGGADRNGWPAEVRARPVSAKSNLS